MTSRLDIMDFATNHWAKIGCGDGLRLPSSLIAVLVIGAFVAEKAHFSMSTFIRSGYFNLQSIEDAIFKL